MNVIGVYTLAGVGFMLRATGQLREWAALAKRHTNAYQPE
jgi:hypothetical protein